MTARKKPCKFFKRIQRVGSKACCCHFPLRRRSHRHLHPVAARVVSLRRRDVSRSPPAPEAGGVTRRHLRDWLLPRPRATCDRARGRRPRDRRRRSGEDPLDRDRLLTKPVKRTKLPPEIPPTRPGRKAKAASRQETCCPRDDRDAATNDCGHSTTSREAPCNRTWHDQDHHAPDIETELIIARVARRRLLGPSPSECAADAGALQAKRARPAWRQ